MSDNGALTFSLTWVYVNEVSDGKNISIGAVGKRTSLTPWPWEGKDKGLEVG